MNVYGVKTTNSLKKMRTEHTHIIKVGFILKRSEAAYISGPHI